MTIDDILDDAVRFGSPGPMVAHAGQPGDEGLIRALADAADALVDSLSMDGRGHWHSARRSGRLR